MLRPQGMGSGDENGWDSEMNWDLASADPMGLLSGNKEDPVVKSAVDYGGRSFPSRQWVHGRRRMRCR